jgi:hypothetical protein
MGNSSSSSKMNKRYSASSTKLNVLEGITASKHTSVSVLPFTTSQKMTAEELLEFMETHKNNISKILSEYAWKSKTDPLWNVTDGAVSTISVGEGPPVSLVECMAISSFYFDHGKAEFQYRGNKEDNTQAEKMINALNDYIKTHFRRK